MGCMATAMTIMMDYHKAPKNYNYGTVTENNGLAQLMYDAAKSINTQFGEIESSAALSEVALQLVNKFGYDVTTLKYRLKAQSGLGDNDWVALIVRDINNGMPVIYSAGTVPASTVNKEGGQDIQEVTERHAFVIDGIRMNVASPNGYDFHINAGQGTGISSDENSKWVSDIFSVTINGKTYSDTPEMITGIRTSEEAEAGSSSLKIMSYEGSRGLSMSVNTISVNTPFNVSVSSLQNWDEDGKEFVGYVFPVLVRTEGGKAVVTTPSNTASIAKRYVSGSGFTYRQILASLTFSNVVFGTAEDAGKNLQDYVLRLATADKVDGSYQLKLIETLAGESSDVIGAVPAVNNNTVKLTFTNTNGGLIFKYRKIASSGMTFPEINGTIEVPYGQPFLFFAQRATTAGGEGTVILTAENKYLMKDYFDDPSLQERLIAAYCIGWRVTEDDIEAYPHLKMAEGEKDTCVIISFNSEAADVSDSMIVPEGVRTLSINPLNWKTDSTYADKSLNIGACFTDYSGTIIEEIPCLTGAYIDPERGTLKVTDVPSEEYSSALFGDGVYHLYDYQFFFRNLEENVIARTEAWLDESR